MRKPKLKLWHGNSHSQQVVQEMGEGSVGRSRGLGKKLAKFKKMLKILPLHMTGFCKNSVFWKWLAFLESEKNSKKPKNQRCHPILKPLLLWTKTKVCGQRPNCCGLLQLAWHCWMVRACIIAMNVANQKIRPNPLPQLSQYLKSRAAMAATWVGLAGYSSGQVHCTEFNIQPSEGRNRGLTDSIHPCNPGISPKLLHYGLLFPHQNTSVVEGDRCHRGLKHNTSWEWWHSPFPLTCPVVWGSLWAVSDRKQVILVYLTLLEADWAYPINRRHWEQRSKTDCVLGIHAGSCRRIHQG